jgi:hypothetical protein
MSENQKDQDDAVPRRTSPGPPVDSAPDDVAPGRASPGPPVVPADHEEGGKAGDYDDWTVDDLQERAAEIGIEGRSDMNKDELIEALRNH